MTLFNKTKIVATVGPASNTKEKLHELIVAGVNVFRLNFSHGTHEDHLKVIVAIKELNQAFNYNVSILQDLQGPKIRISDLENGGFEIKPGEDLVITTDEVAIGTRDLVGCSYKALAKDVKSGDAILIDDGNLEVRVYKVDGNTVYTKVVYGGKLKPRKGMNLPDTEISEPSLTKKDRRDLAFGLENDVDWVAISFVRTPGDVMDLRHLIEAAGSEAKIVSKIERPEALKNIDGIIEQSDALMVARGDLGVEVQMEDVPVHQKRIVKKCNIAAKPVIIATQMMESMIDNPRPTRAEANDVANAVMDGADAVMLSAETASGKYPVETIKAMTKIIRSVEQQVPEIYNKAYDLNLSKADFGSETIVNSACTMAKATNAEAIIGLTFSGFTARHIARCRPEARIYIFSANKKLLTQLNLVWGVRGFYYNKFESTDSTFRDIEEILVREGLLRRGDLYMSTASMPIGAKKRTNVLKFNKIE